VDETPPPVPRRGAFSNKPRGHALPSEPHDVSACRLTAERHHVVGRVLDALDLRREGLAPG
jgi:hypothetical protein